MNSGQLAPPQAVRRRCELQITVAFVCCFLCSVSAWGQTDTDAELPAEFSTDTPENASDIDNAEPTSVVSQSGLKEPGPIGEENIDTDVLSGVPSEVAADTSGDTDIDDGGGEDFLAKEDTTVEDEGSIEESEALLDVDDANSFMDVSLEELLATPVEVWSATKTEETVETAPSVIEVVTARDISMWGYSTVAEVLQHMLGFYIIDDHILPNAAVRGISGGLSAQSGIIKVMINGRSIAFRSTSGNWLGFELIPMIAVERIEVIRGPASALYGADAFLGTVNIVLKKPESMDAVAVSGALYGTADSMGGALWDMNRQFELVAGTQKGNFGFMMSLGGRLEDRAGLRLPSSSPTPFIPTYNMMKTKTDKLEHRSKVWYAEVSYQKDWGSLKLSGYASSIERSGEFSRWTQLSEGLDSLGRSSGTNIQLQQLAIGVDGELKPTENLILSLNLTYFNGVPGDLDRIEVASDLLYVRRKFRFHGFNGVLEANWRASKRLTFIIGTEMILDHEHLGEHERIDKNTGNIIGSIDAAHRYKMFLNPAGYLQANATVIPEFLKLTGGLRLDYHNIYGGKITGRAGSVFIWSKKFTTKLLYGSAFKAPSPTLLYAVPIMPGDVVGNEDLEPQYVHTFEFAPSLRATKNLTIYGASAYSIILDKAEFVPQGTNITAQNVSKEQTLSFEVGANFAFEDLIAAYVTGEYQRSVREQQYEDYRSNLIGTKNIICPAWIVRAGASYSMPFSNIVPLRVASRVMLVGERRASGGNIVENGGEYYLPAYAMWDAFLSSDKFELLPSGKTTIRFSAYNLLDVDGPDPGFSGVDYPLLPRRFMLEAEQSF